MKHIVFTAAVGLALIIDLTSAHAQESDAPEEGSLVLILSEYADLADRRIALLEKDLELCATQRNAALDQAERALEIAALVEAIAREQARAERAGKRARRAVWASIGVSVVGSAAAAVMLR